MKKIISLYIMSCLYVLAGINHFIHPDTYLKIIPNWLGWHEELNYISGACEILFALMLIPIKTRRTGAWCIIALLISVFPANVQMTVNYMHQDNLYLWIAILRLPVQGLLIWWAYIYTKVQ